MDLSPSPTVFWNQPHAITTLSTTLLALSLPP